MAVPICGRSNDLDVQILPPKPASPGHGEIHRQAEVLEEGVLTRLDDGSDAAPLVQDTIDVDGHMGSAVVEFTAHNPGDWLLHCHKPMHMDGGMISLVKIG